MFDEEWVPVHSKFPDWDTHAKQLVNKSSTSPEDALMMLPTDLALATDPVFRPIAEEYARDQDVFFRDFAAAYARLLELGCDF